jgi:hypothetical protein
MAGTTYEGAALASVLSVGVRSTSYWDGGRCGLSQILRWRERQVKRCSGLCSLGRRGLTQPLWWRIRHVSALLWPLIAWFAWDHPTTVLAGTTAEGVALASVQSVGVFPSQPLWRKAPQVRALRWLLLSLSVWAQAATVVADTTGDGAALASVPSVGEG